MPTRRVCAQEPGPDKYPVYQRAEKLFRDKVRARAARGSVMAPTPRPGAQMAEAGH